MSNKKSLQNQLLIIVKNTIDKCSTLKNKIDSDIELTSMIEDEEVIEILNTEKNEIEDEEKNEIKSERRYHRRNCWGSTR